MRYNPPMINEQVQWVPIVAKDKNWLVGYISGIHMIESLVIDTLEENGINIDLRGIDLCLDSSRFNDILENGKRESECTSEEIKKYYKDMIEEKMAMVREKHPDNDTTVFGNCFLEVECICGLGVYTFNSAKEIPEKPFKCQICGRIVIDYTYHDDEEFDFDGEISSRLEKINEEIQEQINKEVEQKNQEIEDEYNDDEDEDDELEDLF